MTQPLFQVGDLVIMQHATYHDEHDGMPAVVTGGRASREATDLRTMRQCRLAVSYKVQLLGLDEVFIVAPWQIRKPDAGARNSVARRRREQV